MRRAILLLLLFLGASAQLAIAQTRHVKGKVNDEKGTGIANAGVGIKNTSTGTITDVDGNFDIDMPDGDKILIIQAIGFTTREVEVTGNAVIVTMKSSSKVLNETVVTALGIKRESKTLAYATQTVGGDQMNKSGSGNALGELDGKVAGLQVINSSGDPGAGTYVRLRGITSLTGDNQPLIVIDGIPMDNSINNYDPTNSGFQAGGANGNLTGGSMSSNRGLDINPNDIESINVLKGPAATALYGLKAASGVLMITTKKGNSGGAKGMHVTVNSSYSVDMVNKLPEMQNKYSEGADGLYRDNYNNSATPTVNPKKFSWGAEIDTLMRTGVSNVYDPNGKIVGKSNPLGKYAATPYDAFKFFQNGYTANNNVAISGGDDKNSYRVSLGNMHQNGTMPTAKYDKTTFGISGQSAVNDKLTISGSAYYTGSGNDKIQQGSNTSGIMLGLLRTPPTFDDSYGNSNGATSPNAYTLPNGNQRNYRGGGGYDNPYWTVNRSPSHDDLNRAYGFGQANYKVNNWMDLTYRLGGDVYSQSSKQSYDIGSNGVASGGGMINLIDYFNRQFNSDFIVNMHKTFNKDFGGSVIVGENYFSQVSSTRFVQGTNLTLPNFLDISNATALLSSEGESKLRRSAWYGQAEGGYKNMLYVTLTGRDETSSTLPEKNNNFFYPSAGLSFIFTEPLGLSGSNTLSYGKFRMSYAQAGKDASAQGLTTPFGPAKLQDGFTSGLAWPINGISGFQQSNSVTVLGNPDLKPEHTNSYELGTDLSFFHNKISFSGTYYYALTTDAIIQVPVAYSTGYAAALMNVAKISNQGVELTINTTPIKTKYGLRWDLSFNYSKNINKVINLANGVTNLFVGGFQNGSIVDIPGQPAGLIYGTKFVRDTKTGKYLINDDKTDPGFGMPIVDPNATNQVIGNTNPDWIGSIISNLSYKGLSLGIQIAIRQGGQMWDGTRGAMDYFGTAGETVDRTKTTTFSGIAGHLDATGNIVSTGNQVTTSAVANQYYWQNIGNSFTGPTESTVEDASFIKLRQISLTYALPSAISKKMHFQSVAVSAFANNIILWTAYKGVDPETSLAGPSNAQGLDYFNSPGIKSYGLRLNLGL